MLSIQCRLQPHGDHKISLLLGCWQEAGLEKQGQVGGESISISAEDQQGKAWIWAPAGTLKIRGSA